MQSQQPPNSLRHCRPNPARHTPRKRGTQYAAASRLNHCCLWNTGSPACAGDDNRECCAAHLRDPAAYPARVDPSKTPPSDTRGRGECRVRAAPAVSCAIVREIAHTSIQVQRKHSGIPRAMALRLITCSPRRRILSCHRRRRIEGLANPVGFAKTSAGLTPATGAGTTRLCRTLQRRPSARPDRSRAFARPATTSTRPTLPRPPHPAPRFVTFAKRPSSGTGRRQL
jgi:hypothetical protein